VPCLLLYTQFVAKQNLFNSSTTTTATKVGKKNFYGVVGGVRVQLQTSAVQQQGYIVWATE
jgi:hypothetical protein